MKGCTGASSRTVTRCRVLLGCWIAAAALLVGRSAQLQLVEASEWRAKAEDQHRVSTEIAAPRGAIVDRNGVALVESREIYEVGVAPAEVTDRDSVMSTLQEVLGVSTSTARRVTDPEARWKVVPGRYEPSVRAPLEGVPGVHLSRHFERYYPHGELALGILGPIVDGKGVGGIEAMYDEVLRGRPGLQVVAQDADRNPLPGDAFLVEAPRPGGQVRLSLDLGLQEIAQDALARALERTGARGGDLVVADPGTGELLAMVSVVDGEASALSAINAPYEPGSTFKPFTVAALLRHRLASLGDTVDTEEGYWIAPGGRPLRDVHAEGRITLGDAVRVSSNIGVAKAALRLTPAQHYEALRDFGFGMPTGIELPGEHPGTLRKPDDWTARSPVAHAIGYEAGVTPLQMTMAYGALANGGELMEPLLVREVRDGAGRVVEARRPRSIRRVADPGVTRELTDVLVDVVEDGTGTRARMQAFRVAGKSGTTKVWEAGKGYQSGRHFASFVGFFPADDPQLVIFVKVDSPREGGYYGGQVAGPVTRETMEAVLATRQPLVDRAAFAELVSASAGAAGSGAWDAGPAANGGIRFAADGGRSARSRRPVEGSRIRVGPPPAPPRQGVELTLPDLSDLDARSATRRLHELGLRVEAREGRGHGSTIPRQGSRVEVGDTVVLVVRRPVGPGAGR